MASVQGIYVAFFGRPADPLGLAYWQEQTQGGANLSVMLDALSGTQEYQDRFDGMNHAEVIASVYAMLFDRDPEPEGLAYFLQALESGAQTLSSIALNILQGAKGDDLETLNAKITAADLFTNSLDTDAKIDAYAGTDAGQIGIDFLNSVSKDSPVDTQISNEWIQKLSPGEGQTPGNSGGDGGGGGGDQTKPVFTSGTTADVDENVAADHVVYTAAATDNVAIAVYELGGADAAAFNIDASTGVVTIKETPDFETKSSYSFNVIARDAAGNSATQTVTLSINNLDEAVPIISSENTASVDENVAANHVVYRTVATDDIGVILYELGGTDAAAFNIDASTGTVTIKASPDFETKSSYSFDVIASDKVGKSATQTVTLSINNLDEAVPFISSGDTASVDENVAANHVVYTTVATDDIGVILYQLGGTDAAAFNIDASTGTVTIKASPDFETKSSYSFDVIASDKAGNSATKTVTLSINNLDEAAPVISSGNTASVDENVAVNHVVYTTVATDDIAVTLYQLAGTDAAAFDIDTNGVVTIKASPDFETKSSYSFDVIASDKAGKSATKTVTLSINNLDEAAPVISSGNTASVDENVAVNHVVYTTVATDDIGVTLYQLAGTDAAAFDIDTNGVVTIKASPDFETKSSYSFDVIAKDAAGKSATKTVILSINNVAEFQTHTGDDGHNVIDKTGSIEHWTINGLGGNDTITGGTGNDTIRGGRGHDTIILTQGGKDTVVFESTTNSNLIDTITGFTAGENGDVLSFAHLTGGIESDGSEFIGGITPYTTSSKRADNISNKIAVISDNINSLNEQGDILALLGSNAPWILDPGQNTAIIAGSNNYATIFIWYVESVYISDGVYRNEATMIGELNLTGGQNMDSFHADNFSFV